VDTGVEHSSMPPSAPGRRSPIARKTRHDSADDTWRPQTGQRAPHLVSSSWDSTPTGTTLAARLAAASSELPGVRDSTLARNPRALGNVRPRYIFTAIMPRRCADFARPPEREMTVLRTSSARFIKTVRAWLRTMSARLNRYARGGQDMSHPRALLLGNRQALCEIGAARFCRVDANLGQRIIDRI
jgi:hypothetical protein